MKNFNRILFDDAGQSLVEYSLILSLVVITAIGVLIIFGESVYDLYETIREDVFNVL